MRHEPAVRDQPAMLPAAGRGARAGYRLGALAVVGGLVVVGIIAFLVASASVQAGHVGLVLTFGRVEPVVLQPGFHLIVPISQRIVQVDCKRA